MKTKILPEIRYSNEKVKRKSNWINRERVLIIPSRGISFSARHLLRDIQTMMPHSKTDSKLDQKKGLSVLNELAEMGNCSKVLFFEARKKKDLYLWLSGIPNGPCMKFLVENINTTSELKLTGNCLKCSRPILAFDSSFSDPDKPHMHLIKEMFVQTFGTPNHHPRSQPYIDKVFSFVQLNGRIWFRVYQILENGSVVEIGPRFSLVLIKIFSKSFFGSVLYTNSQYISPNLIRRTILREKQYINMDKTAKKSMSKSQKKARITLPSNFHDDDLDDIFE